MCSRNRLNWKKIDEVQNKYLPNAKNDTVEIFRKFFAAFDGIRFGSFENLKPILSLNLNPINKIQVNSVLKDLSMTCDEVFLKNKCFWKGVQKDCCEIFFEENTEAGICLVFNSVFSEGSQTFLRNDHYYPFANDKSGEGSGLQAVIKIDPDTKRKNNTDPDGVWMMIKNPLEWTHHTILIRAKTDTSVIITPEIINSDESIRVVPPHQRKCVFTGEENLEFYKLDKGEKYRRSNCITQCHQWYLNRFCNCTISLYFSHKSK